MLYPPLILFFTTLGGGLAFLLFKRTNPTALKLSLSFSGAFLFGLTILHLLPDLYNQAAPDIGLFIVGGFLIQVIIEFFSEGIEHGHIHFHKNQHGHFPIAMMTGLSIHSFFEGMPLSMGNSVETGYGLLAGLILHHLPVGFALMSLLIHSGLKHSMAIFYLLIFCMMTPLGAITGQFVNQQFAGAGEFQNAAMALVTGIFLHISTTILFESGDEHRFNLIKLLTILAGVFLAALL